MNDTYNSIIETLDRIILKMDDMERRLDIIIDELEKFKKEIEN